MLVYHFLNARWANENLEKSRLKISRFEDLNDPFELLAADLKDEAIRKAFQDIRDHMCGNRGVVCFSRSWHNPLLWSHYADKHRGVCLGFEVPDGHIVQVSYEVKRLVNVVPKLLSCGPAAETLMTRLLATKFQDWRYEDEVRVYTDLSDRDAVTSHYFKDFDHDLALREVILGCRFSGAVPEIRALAHNCFAGVSMIQTRLAFTSFRVERDKHEIIV
ncbi:DUF2971 domain-containing protein [Deltaproteobacteria bacterium TL4]